MYCECVINSPEHTIFVCKRWSEMRMSAKVTGKLKLGTDNLMEVMIKSKANCNKVGDMLREMKRKKKKR